jgi:type II restriction/modification system DNA methylase subunit YeeA
MPSVFEEIADYTELLLPDKLLAEGSVIRDLVEEIEEYDWKIELNEEEQKREPEKGEHGIEIIGWLYQYYISEKKDEVVGMNKNMISKEDIPAATQLFTPKWIVKYMVENSLGRLWLESHPNDQLKAQWKYYLEEAQQEPEVQKQLDELKDPNLNPEGIKVLDPAMGSGHILVYAFDVLYDIYLSAGYSEREIPTLILEKNLYGLDIDDRAGQLASFALLMKARSKNRRIFRNKPKMNLCSIQESNDIPKEAIEYLVNPKETELEKHFHREDVEYLIEVFHDAKEYGSILEVKKIDFDTIEKRIEEIRNDVPEDLFELQYREVILEKIPPLIKQAKIMSQKYDVVCTNPPYMGRKYINTKLREYIDDNFYKVRVDLFSVFIERNYNYAKFNGHLGFMTPFVWMFITSYEELREKMINEKSITSLVQLEYSGFTEATVPVCTFTLRNIHTGESGEYVSLSDFKGADKQPLKTLEAAANREVNYRFTVKSDSFINIPGTPIVYWISNKTRMTFKEKKLRDYADVRKGLSTGNNAIFIRGWFEVNFENIYLPVQKSNSRNYKWVPIKKGGAYRSWYGNQEDVILWENDGQDVKNYNGSVIRNQSYYFKESISWTMISNSKLGMRYYPEGFIFEGAGPSLFPHNIDNTYVILAFLCSKLASYIRGILNPTMNINIGNIENLPFNDSIFDNKDTIDALSKINVKTSKKDWDSFETSWDFKKHPLLTYKKEADTIEGAFTNWSKFAENQFNQLKANEEELNRIFIEIYGLQDELTPEVADEDITISRADRERDIKSFISYAVGCMFGRYSLDEEGLIYAGGDFDYKFRIRNGQWEIKTKEGWKKSRVNIVEHNVIPIVDGDYFEDGILERFVDFVKVSFGEETLEENLDYIAETLGRKANETSRQAIRRYFLKDFYKDHVKTYKKRPIYWLFDSGRQDGFKALIYMHRYDPSTVARVRTDYLHSLQKKYEAEVSHLDILIDSDISQREKAAARKKKETILKQIEECRIYDEAIAHVANQRIEIDLDDGVKVNYAKFQGIEIPQGKGRKPLKADLLAKI